MSDPLHASATAPHPTGVTPDRQRSLSATLRRRARVRAPDARLALRHAGLPAVLALSAVFNLYRLSQNGYANLFYSAGVRSMLRSWHNFFFVSFDPGGLVTVDKPPLALWVQTASAKLFGFSPLSLLVPEALAGVLAVAVLYIVLARRLGALAAFAGSLALAVFPSFVAVSRDNGVDPVLILALVLACSLALRASETGRWRTLIGSAVLVGLAFNTKTLAAYLVVPPIALGFLVCAPGSLRRRIAQLLAAGVALAVVSLAWIAVVELTPASQRPYVGSSINNTEIGLAFEYNGLGRVEGQTGGPSRVHVYHGAYVPASHQHIIDAAVRAANHGQAPLGPANPPLNPALEPAPASPPKVTTGREKNPIPFGESPKPLRLFGKGLGDQAGWLLPFAVFGLIGLALLVLVDRGHGERGRGDRPRFLDRRDPRLAMLLVLGGWFVVEAAVLSLSKGIVHPYYVSALAPGVAAMAGAGVAAFVKLARARLRDRVMGLALAAGALATTVLAQVVLMHREHYLVSFVPVLAGGVALGFLALLALRRLAGPALALAFALVLVVPSAYASTTWLAPVEGTFPVAGAKALAGSGGYGVNERDAGLDRALANYIVTHRPGSRWALLTVAADTGAPLILMGLDAGALGGYSGTDPAVDGPRLARMVASGQARYVLLGGEYSLRGGNLATKAVLRACKELAPSQWHSPVAFPYGLVLFDCAGDERALSAAG
ncbi:MAG TPA: glycosyltransferase family 39 protein [Solirubrobacteraceae bacterium]|nr:glycosyltransferase family 39 protein [Solirubrobacteraceae bacterium]